jgi:hypothetical protein
VKELRTCPNGEAVTKTEKLVLYALADYHQDKMGVYTFPSVRTLAEESLMDVRSCRRLLQSIERKGVIEREWQGAGAGHLTFYRFLDLDKEEAQRGASDAGQEHKKRGHSVPFSAAAFLSKKGAKRGQKGDTAAPLLLEEQEQEQKLHPPTPLASEGGAASGKNDLSTGRRIDAAVKRVMTMCGFTARRLRLKLRAVVEQEDLRTDTERPFEFPEETADAMIDAWQRYGRQGARLYRHRDAAEFFEGGFWRNSNLWDWDKHALREEGLAAHAGVGSER